MTVARKIHQCMFCLTPILKGEDYYREPFTPWSSTDNEVFWVLKAHHRCHDSFVAFVDKTREEWGEPDIDEWREYIKDGLIVLARCCDHCYKPGHITTPGRSCQWTLCQYCVKAVCSWDSESIRWNE